MNQLIANLNETKSVLLRKCGSFPKICIVLGSGLSNVLADLEKEVEIPYRDIPFMKPSTVIGHEGKLVIGKLGGVRVACMQGRLHFYEGYSMQDVVFPYRAFAWSGAETFIVTNAAGGLHADMVPSDLVLLTDHINMMGANPLEGANVQELGDRFPDMSTAYSPALRTLLLSCAKKVGVKMREGVYLGIHGPSYETPAEIRAYRTLGADVVGMSTVPEVIALNHMGKKILGISCVTNLAAGVGNKPLVHDEVLEIAKGGHKGFADLVKEFVKAVSI